MSEHRRESDIHPETSHASVDHSPIDTGHLGADHGGADYERRDVNPRTILVSTFIGVILIAVSLIWLDEYFTGQREFQYTESVLKPESSALRDLKAREAEVLNSYKVLDAQKGIYQIPISVAMERIAEEAYQKTLDQAKKTAKK